MIELVSHKSIHDEAVRKIRENFQPLDIDIFVHILSSRIDMECKYTKIHLNKWNRRKLFKSYIDNMRIVMSLTVDIDVSKLIEFSKSNSLKFYPSMIWVVSKVVNAHDEFKYSWDRNGDLIKWEYISPSYIDFHKEDENFTIYG